MMENLKEMILEMKENNDKFQAEAKLHHEKMERQLYEVKQNMFEIRAIIKRLWGDEVGYEFLERVK